MPISLSGSLNLSGSLTTTGTITATTLVVQTITSSISSITGSTNFGSLSSDTHTFTGSLNVTGALYVTTGSVGIGVISPASKLEIKGFGTPNSIMTQPIIAAYATNGFNLGSDGTNALIGVTNSGTDMVFLKRAGGEYSEAMRLTSGGNIGLGITSSAWNGIYRVFQIDAGSISSSPSYNNISVGSNVFYNAGNSPRYIVSDYATLYGQDDGLHAWYTAPSGTAGAAMTFTQSMTIANTGQVFIGTTSALFNTLVNINYNQSTYEGIAISTDKVYNSSPQPNLIFGGKYNSSGNYRQHATIQSLKDNATDGNSAASLVFSTNGNSASVTERMRISSDGVKFQNGATSLNYYEEGTFAPTNLSQNFNAVTVIYGRYVRIGNQVTINCRWNVDVNTTGKKYLIFDLPFAFFNNANINFTGHVSNYNNGDSVYSSNVGTSVRNSSSSTTQQYIEAVYTSTGIAVTLLFSMTYQTF